MIELGIGAMVRTPQELSAWIDSLTPDKLSEIKKAAFEYVKSNLGATDEIIKTIENSLWQKK